MIQNPILRGFSPDPSIIRVNNDYYIATSTFEWWPGVRLWHSRDLKHWEQLPSPLRRQSQLNMIGNPVNGGIWAPCLSYCDGRFYLVYTDVKTQKRPYYNTHNYLVWSDNITGEWSDPVYLNSTGFDPSLFHAKNGKKYIINMRNGFKGILLQEYDPEKQKLVGPVFNIFPGTDLGYTEGPHLYEHNGWYYLITAEGGTSYNHCVTVARSKNLTGPYEVDPANPILTSMDTPDAYLQRAGHADLVETQNGEWYMVHLCGRPLQEMRACILGRETAIQKMEWTEDGWIRPVDGRVPARSVAEPAGIPDYPLPTEPERDDFSSVELPVWYSTLRAYPEGCLSLTERPGWLRLRGQDSITSLHHVSLVARRQTASSCTVETGMEFHADVPEQVAGLAYIYNNENFYMLLQTTNEAGKPMLTFLKSDRNVITETDSPIALVTPGMLRIRLEVNGKDAQFFYACGKEDWKPAFEPFDCSILSDEHCPGFTGAQFALYCHDMTGSRKNADFDYFSVQQRTH